MSDYVVMIIDDEEVTLDVLNGQTKDKKKVVIGFAGNPTFRKIYPAKVFEKMKKDAINYIDVEIN